VRKHADVVLVRFVDQRAIRFGRRLRLRATAIGDPHLDDRNVLRGNLLHHLSRIGIAGDAVHDWLADHGELPQQRGVRAGTGRPGACREHEPRTANLARGLVALNLLREIHRIGSGGEDRADAVIREAIERIDHVLARVVPPRPPVHVLVAHMHVGVDERGHHRLSGEIHACRASRPLHVAHPAHPCDPAALDDQDAVVDDATVANEQPRPFERGGRRLLRTDHHQRRERQRKRHADFRAPHETTPRDPQNRRSRVALKATDLFTRSGYLGVSVSRPSL
jgi:hypothetical protein